MQYCAVLCCSDSELHALSFSGGMHLKTRSKYGHAFTSIHFYGDDIDTLRDHFISHMRHLAATVCRQDSSLTTDSCRKTSLFMHFPSTLNTADVDAVVRAELLRREQPNGIGLESIVLRRTSEFYTALESAR